MKKLLGILLLTLSASAMAQHHGYHGHHGYYRGSNWGWVAPVVIGGAVVYAATRPPVYVQPPIVYTQPSQPYMQAPPVGMHWEEMIDPQTGIRKIVAVPN